VTSPVERRGRGWCADDRVRDRGTTLIVDAAEVAAQMRRMSPQRWLLAIAAMVAALSAPVATGVAGSNQSPIILAVVLGLAGASVAQPDSHVALTVPLVAVWHWIATTDASTSGWSLAVAMCLFAFHTLVALMSTTPPRATIDPRSLVRWLRRATLAGSATAAVWLLVTAVDRLDLAGNAIVTAAGFVAATTLMVAMIGPRRSHQER
jgi:hypothetical protein